MIRSGSPTSRERGRPRAAQVETVAEIAFAIFRERGFAETTMEEIARQAGIAPATLYRYVSSKAELFWWGYAENCSVFAHELAQRSSQEDDIEAAFGAYRAMLVAAGPTLTRIRDRIALVASEQPDEIGTWTHYITWLGVLTSAITRRHHLESADAATRVRSAALWAALWDAMVLWAQSTDASPTGRLDEAERALRDLPSIR